MQPGPLREEERETAAGIPSREAVWTARERAAGNAQAAPGRRWGVEWRTGGRGPMHGLPWTPGPPFSALSLPVQTSPRKVKFSAPASQTTHAFSLWAPDPQSLPAPRDGRSLLTRARRRPAAAGRQEGVSFAGAAPSGGQTGGQGRGPEASRELTGGAGSGSPSPSGTMWAGHTQPLSAVRTRCHGSSLPLAHEDSLGPWRRDGRSVSLLTPSPPHTPCPCQAGSRRRGGPGAFQP